MPMQNSIISTHNPEDYFSGVSTSGYIKQWSPHYFSSFDETTNQPGISVNWTQAVPGARFMHGVFVPTTAEVSSVPVPVLLRVLCHVIVNNIPDRGLPELFRCACDAYEFHAPQEWGSAALLPPSSRTVTARVRASYERPPFHAAEE